MRSPEEASAAMIEIRRLEDAFLAYVQREEEGKKRAKPKAPPSKASSKRKRVENGPRSGAREDVAIGSAAAMGHMILGSGSKPAAAQLCECRISCM